ncbi:hypothetical protein QR79_16765 [Methylobacterium indicum]|uniref:Uncharacterized protein n=1 Tax=Methylobacterium indicum TaxID=1775910 RepID=A0ABR5H9K0_9HYPH|nr:hypothetical protein QR79_16765 [Methylobacterium indicum]
MGRRRRSCAIRGGRRAAGGAGEVTQTITGVAGTAQDTGVAAQPMLATASDLSRHSHLLDREVARFLSGVRAAEGRRQRRPRTTAMAAVRKEGA